MIVVVFLDDDYDVVVYVCMDYCFVDFDDLFVCGVWSVVGDFVLLD